MNTKSKIELFGQGKAASLDDLLRRPIDVFFALAIVNPIGPTLSFVAVRRDDGQSPIFNVMLNPFRQLVETVGTFVRGEGWISREDVGDLLKLGFGGCPTIVIVNACFSPDERVAVIQQILECFPTDVGRVSQSVWEHLGDPWTRIQEAMEGRTPVTSMTPSAAASLLAPQMVAPEHFLSELDAFFHAWHGSINYSGIPEEMVAAALPSATMRELFSKLLLPSLWIPNTPSDEERSSGPRSIEDEHANVRRHLHSGDWRKLAGESLIQVVFKSLVLYGSDCRASDIAALGLLYAHAVANASEDLRTSLGNEIGKLTGKGALMSVALLPIIIVETTRHIVSSATIQFVSDSPVDESGSYALRELYPLMAKGTIQNRGAVFGALVCMGEAQLRPYIDQIRQLMTPEEVNESIQVQTAFIQHHAVQFWLDWAKDLISSNGVEEQNFLGSCAAALIFCLQHDQYGKVFEVARDLPCTKEGRFHYLRTWTIAEYAVEIAPALYRLERAESAPKVFPHVLKAWGLTPKSVQSDWVPGPE